MVEASDASGLDIGRIDPEKLADVLKEVNLVVPGNESFQPNEINDLPIGTRALVWGLLSTLATGKDYKDIPRARKTVLLTPSVRPNSTEAVVGVTAVIGAIVGPNGDIDYTTNKAGDILYGRRRRSSEDGIRVVNIASLEPYAEPRGNSRFEAVVGSGDQLTARREIVGDVDAVIKSALADTIKIGYQIESRKVRGTNKDVTVVTVGDKRKASAGLRPSEEAEIARTIEELDRLNLPLIVVVAGTRANLIGANNLAARASTDRIAASTGPFSLKGVTRNEQIVHPLGDERDRDRYTPHPLIIDAGDPKQAEAARRMTLEQTARRLRLNPEQARLMLFNGLVVKVNNPVLRGLPADYSIGGLLTGSQLSEIITNNDLDVGKILEIVNERDARKLKDKIEKLAQEGDVSLLLAALEAERTRVIAASSRTPFAASHTSIRELIESADSRIPNLIAQVFSDAERPTAQARSWQWHLDHRMQGELLKFGITTEVLERIPQLAQLQKAFIALLTEKVIGFAPPAEAEKPPVVVRIDVDRILERAIRILGRDFRNAGVLYGGKQGNQDRILKIAEVLQSSGSREIAETARLEDLTSEVLAVSSLPDTPEHRAAQRRLTQRLTEDLKLGEFTAWELASGYEEPQLDEVGWRSKFRAELSSIIAHGGRNFTLTEQRLISIINGEGTLEEIFYRFGRPVGVERFQQEILLINKYIGIVGLEAFVTEVVQTARWYREGLDKLGGRPPAGAAPGDVSASIVPPPAEQGGRVLRRRGDRGRGPTAGPGRRSDRGPGKRRG